jgi:hypothetical protein
VTRATFLGRYGKRRVGHLERCEDLVAQEDLERLA